MERDGVVWETEGVGSLREVGRKGVWRDGVVWQKGVGSVREAGRKGMERRGGMGERWGLVREAGRIGEWRDGVVWERGFGRQGLRKGGVWG